MQMMFFLQLGMKSSGSARSASTSEEPLLSTWCIGRHPPHDFAVSFPTPQASAGGPRPPTKKQSFNSSKAWLTVLSSNHCAQISPATNPPGKKLIAMLLSPQGSPHVSWAQRAVQAGAFHQREKDMPVRVALSQAHGLQFLSRR